MKNPTKTTFITTVFNEEKTIKVFLDSLLSQTQLPHEIIVVDGRSTDATVQLIKIYDVKFKRKKVKFKLLVKRGNRSVGRNEAIRNATGDIILCSDAGNILDKNWIKEITKPFIEKTVDVVAGYYKGKPKNIFQKCLIPYVLVMPDKVNPDRFLPATRSIAFKKSIWKKVGGFDKRLSHNEDYVFAKKLKEKGANIVFAKDAIVHWLPRNNFKEVFVMFFRFALGDAESGMWRTNVLLLFARYFLGFYLIYLGVFYKSFIPFIVIFISFLFYIIWSIKKNYRYVKDAKAYTILPLLQLNADFSVITGTLLGALKRLNLLIIQNKFLSIIIFFYTIFILLVLSWGAPNMYHPFPYHMDEWHQLMAVKAIVKHGTTTIAGSAEIPFVYPVLSGLYLIPFTLFQYINPFLLKSPLENLLMQERLFEVLRSVNIFFGVGSIILIATIAKKYLKINYLLPVFFFTISPSLLLLSTYFKYDIGLLFWITFSLYTFFRFASQPTVKNFLFSAIACGVAMGTKFSAIPLLPLLVIAFFLFNPYWRKQLKLLFIGVSVYLLTFLIIGVPNVLIGTGHYQALLFSNLIEGPAVTNNFNLPYHWLIYLFVNQFPILFGQPIFILSIAAVFYLLYLWVSKYKFKIMPIKFELFLLLGFLFFLASLMPLKVSASSNRALVLLPFLALMTGIFITQLSNNIKFYYKIFLWFIVSVLMIIQLYQVGAWLSVKYSADIQRTSSVWIENHIARGTTIGIENMALYQGLPNILVKEFYNAQYKYKEAENRYQYTVIDNSVSQLPSIVIISDDELYKRFYNDSPKKELVYRLEKEGYKKIASFIPNLTYLRLFTNDIDYSLAAIASVPSSISVYKKSSAN